MSRSISPSTAISAQGKGEDSSRLAAISAASRSTVSRRAALFQSLQALGGQVWMTGADLALFQDLRGRADIFKVSNGAIGLVESAGEAE